MLRGSLIIRELVITLILTLRSFIIIVTRLECRTSTHFRTVQACVCMSVRETVVGRGGGGEELTEAHLIPEPGAVLAVVDEFYHTRRCSAWQGCSVKVLHNPRVAVFALQEAAVAAHHLSLRVTWLQQKIKVRGPQTTQIEGFDNK